MINLKFRLISRVALSVLLFGNAVCLVTPARARSGVLNTEDAGSSAPAVKQAPANSGPRNPDRRTQAEASCGMSCLYHRANDNLTLQALYLVTKVQKVGEAINKDSNDSSARAAIGGFCESDTEELSDCFNRYKAFQRVALLQIRNAIGKNEDTIARLTAGRQADGTVQGTAVVYGSDQDPVPYVPDVPTLADLEKSYREGKLRPTGSSIGEPEIKKWSQELVVNNPKVHFLEFEPKTVEGNPYQPGTSGYSLHIIKNDGTGKPVGEDLKAKQMNQAATAVIRKFSTDQSTHPKVLATEPKDLKTRDKLSYQAFTQSRSVLNTKIKQNEQIPDEVQSPRRLASVTRTSKDGKTPSPTPSGAPAALGPGAARDVNIATAVAGRNGGSATRLPSGYLDYGDDKTVSPPPGMKDSHYIKYDLTDLMNDIEGTTGTNR